MSRALLFSCGMAGQNSTIKGRYRAALRDRAAAVTEYRMLSTTTQTVGEPEVGCDCEQSGEQSAADRGYCMNNRHNYTTITSSIGSSRSGEQIITSRPPRPGNANMQAAIINIDVRTG